MSIENGDVSIKYTVEIKNGDDLFIDTPSSCRESIRIARNYSKLYPNAFVFVKFFRPSDHQHGYLNPDCNHAINGHSW